MAATHGGETGTGTAVREAIERQASRTMAAQNRSFQGLVRNKRRAKESDVQSNPSQRRSEEVLLELFQELSDVLDSSLLYVLLAPFQLIHYILILKSLNGSLKAIQIGLWYGYKL